MHHIWYKVKIGIVIRIITIRPQQKQTLFVLLLDLVLFICQDHYYTQEWCHNQALNNDGAWLLAKYKLSRACTRAYNYI